ncbi:hypothetical protein ISCGN_023878 [Ixodes scapularis]
MSMPVPLDDLPPVLSPALPTNDVFGNGPPVSQDSAQPIPINVTIAINGIPSALPHEEQSSDMPYQEVTSADPTVSIESINSLRLSDTFQELAPSCIIELELRSTRVTEARLIYLSKPCKQTQQRLGTLPPRTSLGIRDVPDVARQTTDNHHRNILLKRRMSSAVSSTSMPWTTARGFPPVIILTPKGRGLPPRNSAPQRKPGEPPKQSTSKGHLPAATDEPMDESGPRSEEDAPLSGSESSLSVASEPT